jgi:hypothetical protein
VSPQLGRGCTVIGLSILSLGCSFFPSEHRVPLSFSVRVTNTHGPVAGLKLRVTNFNSEEFSELSLDQQRVARPEQFVELIAESYTDASGEAHFKLSRPGHFSLEVNHPASHLDWVALNVVANTKPKTINLEWPTSAILETQQLSGRINKGLMSSASPPLEGVALRLRTLVSFSDFARLFLLPKLGSQ